MSFFRRLAAARLVQPLRERDFALLTGIEGRFDRAAVPARD